MSLISVSYWRNLIGSLSLSELGPRSQNISDVRIMTVWRISQFSQNWSNISVRIIFVDLIAGPNYVRFLSIYLFVSCTAAFTIRKLLECHQVMWMVGGVVQDLEQLTLSDCQYKYHQESQAVHLVNIMKK